MQGYKEMIRISAPTILGTFLLFCLILVGGCESSHDSQAAQQMALVYMKQVQAGDFDQAVKFYPEDTRRNWRDFLQKAQEKNGPIRSYKFTNTEVNTVYSGKYYLFTVDVEYAKTSTTDYLTLFKSVSDDHLFIVSHKITTD